MSEERPALPRRAAAEGLAAFALVFAGCGLRAAGCGAIITNATRQASLGAVGVSLTFGLVVMAMVYATGHHSGAHINPAVTVAFTLTRHFTGRDALAYIAAQLAGATAAAYVLKAACGRPSPPASVRRCRAWRSGRRCSTRPCSRLC